MHACDVAEESADRQEASDLNCSLTGSSAPLLFHLMVSKARSSFHCRPLLLVLLSVAVVNNLFPSFSLLLGTYLESVILYQEWLDCLFSCF